MNPLVIKEIRLLLPAFATALLLAFVPLWIMPGGMAIVLFTVGTVLLALSSFGREFGLKTFPLILAQPLERQRIWRIKIRLLAIAMTVILLAWCAAWRMFHPAPLFQPHFVLGLMPYEREALVGLTIVIVAFAGGLWTTLLFRQITSAFWFCALAPAVIQMTVLASGGSEAVALCCLLLYSIAAVFWSRRYFMRIQESAWTGGDVSIAGWSAADSTREAIRRPKAFKALLLKEAQLHQFNLVGMALLFVLHLLVIVIRKAGHDVFSQTTRSALQVFGGIWFVVPLLVGSTAIAEERKLGIIETHLCLPISRRVQFINKLFLVFIIGVVLSSILAWVAEGIGSSINAGSGVELWKVPFNPNALGLLCLVFLGLALAGFYGSSLSGGLVQAMAAATGTAVVAFVLLRDGPKIDRIAHIPLWQGPLIYYFLAPALVLMAIWLAWRNFLFIPESGRLCRRNAAAWFCSLAVVFSLTTAVYHRAWELVGPFEPVHGAPRIAGEPVRFKSTDYATLGAVLPDGRLWLDRVFHQSGRLHLAFGEGTGFQTGGKFIHHSGTHFPSGSNWVDAAVRFRDVVAIRSDGTLWVSEKPETYGRANLAAPIPPLVQFGSDTNWQSVISDYHYAVVLLKRDGTLWHWGTNDFSDKATWPGLRAFQPVQLGHDSDWAKIVRGSGRHYAWKKDGTAWGFHFQPEWTTTNSTTTFFGIPGLVMERFTPLDGAQWNAFAYYGWYEVGLRGDGTLWIWTVHDPTSSKRILSPKPIQVGSDTDWVALGNGWPTVVALKKNGTLWRWPVGFRSDRPYLMATMQPVRMGTHSDWVGMTSLHDGTVSIAADGSLWFWQNWDDEYGSHAESGQPMLRPSRKPRLIENIFTAGL